MTARAAQRLRRALRPPRRLTFTRRGKWFTAMTFMVGFGAINTGNNLLYLLLGMMLGLIVVSGIVSEIVLRKLRIVRLAATPAFVGRPVVIEYRIENRKRTFPSFSIEIREIETRETRARRRAPASGRETLGGKDPVVPRCLVHRIPPRGSVVRSGGATLPRRGLYRYRGMALITRFPFGFFEKSLEVEQPGEVLVYPRVVEVPVLDTRVGRPSGLAQRAMAGQGDEYHSLREYIDGEDGRRIHWKVSARRGSLVVRENERDETTTTAIGLVNGIPPTRRTDGDSAAQEALERAIEVAAGLARRLLQDGRAVSLHTLDGALPLGSGPGQLSRVLRALALLEIDRVSAVPALAGDARRHARVLVAAVGGAQLTDESRWDWRVRVDRSGRIEVLR